MREQFIAKFDFKTPTSSLSEGSLSQVFRSKLFSNNLFIS